MAASRASHTVLFCWEGPPGVSGRLPVPAAYAAELMRAFAQASPYQRMWVEQSSEIREPRGGRGSKWRAQ